MPAIITYDASSTPPSRRRVSFAVIAVSWTLWGLWAGTQSSLASLASGTTPAPRANPLGLALTGAWLWALLTPPLMWITRRIRDRITTKSGRVTAHAGTFALVHLLD